MVVRRSWICLVYLAFVPALAAAQETPVPAPPENGSAHRSAQGTAPIESKPTEPAAPAAPGQIPPPPPPSPSSRPTESYRSPGSAAPDYGAVQISPAPGPTPGMPLPHPAIRSATVARVEQLMQGAAAMVAQGNLSKAMELYDEALTVAPQYAEAYRQRAMTLLRLGDRVQAQIDYGEFLKLDPTARDRVRNEIQLFEQSGLARLGEAEAAAYGPAVLAAPGDWPMTVALASRPNPPAMRSDSYFELARDAFQGRDYHNAYRWAQRADRAMPQARIHALMAQILFAQRAYRGAAAEARAAASMGPLVDWTTLYGNYDYRVPQYRVQFQALQEFVRTHPSSADGRFLLGYQQLILGQTEQGHAQLAIAAVLEPLDVVARSILARDGVEIVGGEQRLARDASGAERMAAKERPGKAEAPVPSREAATPTLQRR
jgi:tetratricopeptide (TPR) repeat protein